MSHGTQDTMRTVKKKKQEHATEDEETAHMNEGHE